jgi:hypothetical protein
MVNNPASADTTVIKADRPNWLLISLGAALVLLFMGGSVFARLSGGETITTPAPAGTTTSNASATETKTKTKTAPSDTILTALLASGGALILAGALYSRISTITLPGGVSVGLTNKETTTTAETVKNEYKEGTDAQRLAATEAAVNQVREKKALTAAVELPPNDVKQVVRAAIESYKLSQ